MSGKFHIDPAKLGPYVKTDERSDNNPNHGFSEYWIYETYM